MGTFPTPHSVTIITRTEGEPDAYGNPTVTTTETPWEVYGWGPGGSSELTGWSAQVTADLAVYGPQPPTAITSTSSIRVDGVEHEVEGVPQDFDHGPFGYTPGVVVSLSRVSG